MRDARLLAPLIALLWTPVSAAGQDTAQVLSAEERQFGLALVWSAVRENYVNFDRMPIDWDSTFVASIEDVARAESTFEYYQVLRRLVAAIGDGHTKVYAPRDTRASHARNFPLRTHLVEDRVVVWRVLNDSLYALGVRPGMIVDSIDGVDALEFGRTRVMPFEAASTDQDRLLRTYDYELFRGPADRPIRISLSDADGQRLAFTASRMLPWDRSGQREILDFRVLPGNIGYLALNRFDTNAFYAAFDSVYPAVLQTDALILDARINGGGSSSYGYYVIGHLVDHSFQGTRWFSRHYVPKIEAGAPSSDYYLQRRSHYQAADARTYSNPVVLLISEATFSAAEDFAATFDYMGRGEIIGTPSGGSSGQPLVVALPGGGRLRVCTERPTYPDGREFVGVGVIPDVVVAPTIDGVRTGTDDVLDAAIARLASGRD